VIHVPYADLVTALFLRRGHGFWEMDLIAVFPPEGWIPPMKLIYFRDPEAWFMESFHCS
jgi:hypothetical protein